MTSVSSPVASMMRARTGKLTAGRRLRVRGEKAGERHPLVERGRGRGRGFGFGALMDELADAFEEFGEGEGGAVGAPRAAKVRGDPESAEALVEAANASPFFSDAFRAAFEDAQGRIAESKKEETAKINAEVEEIMERVRAQRAGKEVPPRALAPDIVLETASVPTTPTAVSTPAAVETVIAKSSAPAIADPEFTDLIERHLLEMKRTSESQLRQLSVALAQIEKSIAGEKAQLARVETLISKVKREARYRRADEIIRAREEGRR